MPTSIKYVGIPSITAAFGILGVPGFNAALLHLVNNHFHLQLDFNQSHAAGWVFLVVGLIDFITEGIVSVCRTSPFIALRHVSFSPIANGLQRVDLPVQFRARKIEELDCDLYPFMRQPQPDLEVSVRVQAEWARKAEALRTVLRSAPVGYYGIVHVPFQFLAGYMFSSFLRVRLFELDRHDGKWKALSEGRAPDLGVALQIGGDAEADDVAIRIGVSYAVLPQQISAVMPQPYIDASLTIASPRIDAVTSYEQIRNFSNRFRSLLDEPALQGKRKHIFYAGPVSLGFALGQRISSTIHGSVSVYNFNDKSPAKYPWCLTLAMHEQERLAASSAESIPFLRAS